MTRIVPNPLESWKPLFLTAEGRAAVRQASEEAKKLKKLLEEGEGNLARGKKKRTESRLADSQQVTRRDFLEKTGAGVVAAGLVGGAAWLLRSGEKSQSIPDPPERLDIALGEKRVVFEDRIPEDAREAAKKTLEVALTFVLQDKELAQMYERATVIFQPGGSTRQTIDEYKGALQAFGDTHLDAMTVSMYSPDQNVLVHQVVLEASVFQSVARVIAIVDHELRHIALREKQRQETSTVTFDQLGEEEKQVIGQNIRRLERLAQELKIMEEPIALKIAGELEQTIIPQEKETLRRLR